MRKATKLLFAASIGLALCSSRAAWAADDLDKVLRKLDDAAARFHSTSADFQFDSVETDPQGLDWRIHRRTGCHSARPRAPVPPIGGSPDAVQPITVRA